jgi:hypothetical protein
MPSPPPESRELMRRRLFRMSCQSINPVRHVCRCWNGPSETLARFFTPETLNQPLQQYRLFAESAVDKLKAGAGDNGPEDRSGRAGDIDGRRGRGNNVDDLGPTESP